MSIIVAFAFCTTQAQVVKKALNFLGSCKYEIMVGYGTTVASEPFDVAKIGYNLGVTARKEVMSFKDDKIGVYGLTGIILTKRGGKVDDDVMTLADDRRNYSIPAVSVPLHMGGDYKFNKVSLFIDFGPGILFKTGNSSMNNLTSNAVMLDAGFNMGIRFKKFAMSIGVDYGLTTTAKFTPSEGQQEELELNKGKYNLKTGEAHFDLRWTL